MHRHLNRIILGILILLLIGCAPKKIVHPVPAPEKRAPTVETPQVPVPETKAALETETLPEKEMPVVKEPEPSPRALASVELITQARTLIEKGRPDAAIRVLERAVNLYPRNGQAYYYLAEAWLKKGNAPQAKECNRLAGIYLRNDPQWSLRLKIQELKIKNF